MQSRVLDSSQGKGADTNQPMDSPKEGYSPVAVSLASVAPTSSSKRFLDQLSSRCSITSAEVLGLGRSSSLKVAAVFFHRNQNQTRRKRESQDVSFTSDNERMTKSNNFDHLTFDYIIYKHNIQLIPIHCILYYISHITIISCSDQFCRSPRP